ncbi:transmembrane protein, putative (macronuclear) [Tetrahymena thermophila SB210]|uniref:Transmembrane protein, putative n=1 Tax=Tetrahymena thermophila (strain SB210) TaxID=312017 RepID=W7XLF0_TETTS|nr:transmembrane protein, putative [Tetrahymena thermophila SB210]EWS76174.1 transmembrane protein, putative [Tetrahymena thermophila SB210]|eukprot:XP_012651298.1 transmembrane protein, putative [Tetrahymena thermophila SB210]
MIQQSIFHYQAKYQLTIVLIYQLKLQIGPLITLFMQRVKISFYIINNKMIIKINNQLSQTQILQNGNTVSVKKLQLQKLKNKTYLSQRYQMELKFKLILSFNTKINRLFYNLSLLYHAVKICQQFILLLLKLKTYLLVQTPNNLKRLIICHFKIIFKTFQQQTPKNIFQYVLLAPKLPFFIETVLKILLSCLITDLIIQTSIMIQNTILQQESQVLQNKLTL